MPLLVLGAVLAVSGGSATIAAMMSNTILQAKKVAARAALVGLAGLVLIVGGIAVLVLR